MSTTSVLFIGLRRLLEQLFGTTISAPIHLYEGCVAAMLPFNSTEDLALDLLVQRPPPIKPDAIVIVCDGALTRQKILGLDGLYTILHQSVLRYIYTNSLRMNEALDDDLLLIYVFYLPLEQRQDLPSLLYFLLLSIFQCQVFCSTHQ